MVLRWRVGVTGRLSGVGWLFLFWLLGGQTKGVRVV